MGQEGNIPDELAGQPQERLLKVVVGLGRDIVVLQVLLPVECDLLGLDLAILDVHLVSTEDDGNVHAYTNNISVPVGNILVCHAGSDVEHDDGALALDAGMGEWKEHSCIQ